MARGGGRGGGSFGGSRGGGRSFGGSRGGGSRLGGGSSRGRGGFGGNRPSGNYNRPRPRGGYYGGIPPFLGGYGLGRGSRRRRRYNRGGCSGCGGGGCLSSLLIIFLLLFAFNFIWGMLPGNNNTAVQTVQIPSSTIEREAIDSGLVDETAYFEDKLDWIRNPQELEKGLSYFYNQTNVQPFVYITDNINGDPNPNPEEIDEFANALYDDLFTDEAHLLLVHFENSQYQYEYSFHTVYGAQARVLMDNEAESILFDYLQYHYGRDPSKVSEEQFFSDAFKDTADRMMTVTRSPWIPVFIVIGVAVILIVLFNWWRSLLSKNKDNDTKAKANSPKTEESTDSLDDFDF